MIAAKIIVKIYLYLATYPEEKLLINIFGI